jgi:diaminopimelate decarboxylase
MSTGAYGTTMSSHYNSRPFAPEVMIHDGKYHIVRDRESFEDLIIKEKLPTYLKRASTATG